MTTLRTPDAGPGPETPPTTSDAVSHSSLQPGSPLTPPPTSDLRDHHVLAVVVAISAVVVTVWIRHGGIDQVTKGWPGIGSSVTQISGLMASLVGLFGLALIARPLVLERRYGLDRLFVWHRYLGETMAVLVGVHIAASIIEWAPGIGVIETIKDFAGRQPYMAGATIGAALIGIVTITSLRSIRQRMSYETWYFIHLLGYVGFALSFGHEIVLGADLVDDKPMRWLWVAFHVAIAVWVLWERWGRLLLATLRPLRIIATRPLGGDSVEMRIGGPHLARRYGEAGQFVLVRPLTRRLWWQAHPFSLSTAPSRDHLHLTVKARGDASHSIGNLPVGTRVAVEGPYGVCMPEVTEGRRVLCIAGGVGIAPIRAILERLDPAAAPIVLYRAPTREGLIHLDDLQRLTAERGGKVLTLVGPTAMLAKHDPFSSHVLTDLVPDLCERAVIVCGPERLIHAARAGLKTAGVPTTQVHYERAWW